MNRLSHYGGSAVRLLYDALRAVRKVVKLAVMACGNLLLWMAGAVRTGCRPYVPATDSLAQAVRTRALILSASRELENSISCQWTSGVHSVQLTILTSCTCSSQ